MCFKSIPIVIEFLSALFAILAAYYWYQSSKVSIPQKFTLTAHSTRDALGGGYPNVSTVDTRELNALGNSLIDQGKLNSKAAAFSFCSAFLQAVYFAFFR